MLQSHLEQVDWETLSSNNPSQKKAGEVTPGLDSEFKL
jgi:hypothetical protein